MLPSNATITEKLSILEQEARQLEPNEAERAKIRDRVIDYTEAFLNGVEEADVFQILPDKGAEILQHPIAEEGTSTEELLALFERAVDQPGLNPASAGHLGYIPGGGIYPAALGDYLAAVTNRYAGIFFASPGAIRIENQLLRWISDLIGYGTTAAGNLTSGGSIANLIAIVTARDAKGVTSDKVKTSVIYMSEQAHHSVQKALHYAGLTECPLRMVSLDAHFRMDAAALEAQMKADRKAGLTPFMIIASAGTTDTGAMDPLDAIADVSERYNTWFHVDAAYGGFFVLVDELKESFKGVERSDSLVIDPHKGLFLPYGLGAVVIRDGDRLKQSNSYEASYMQDTLQDIDELSPAELGPELSKHFRGLRLWFPIKLFGVKPFRAALEEKLWLCRYFYQEVKAMPQFEVGPEPDLSVAIFRYVPQSGNADEFNQKLVEAIKADGRVFLSSTNIKGTFWIRIAVLAFRTHKHRIDLCLEVLKEKVGELEA